MLWVAGGNWHINRHCNRYRGTRCDLTLPYLSYLTLLTLHERKTPQVGPVEERGTVQPSSQATEQTSRRANEQPSNRAAIGGRHTATGDRRLESRSQNPIMLTYLLTLPYLPYLTYLTLLTLLTLLERFCSKQVP